MEEEREKSSGWRIWLYLTPVYLLLLWPLARWSMKMRAGDIPVKDGDYSAFSSSEGEVKSSYPGLADPQFSDGVLQVRYRSAAARRADEEAAARVNAARATERTRQTASSSRPAGAAGQGGQPAMDDVRRREQMAVGHQRGYLTQAVGAAMSNPGAVRALLNNKYVVDGFMARGTVKNATASADALKNYLKGPGPANFLNNPVVKAALSNPAVVSAVASSGIVAAMMDTPAAKELMRDPNAVAELVSSNPQLVSMAMQDPRTFTMLMSNPEVSGLVGKFDTSRINTR